MNEKEFITELKKLNIEVTPLMIERLEKYYNLKFKNTRVVVDVNPNNMN